MSQSLPHIVAGKQRGIAIVWRNYVTVTLCRPILQAQHTRRLDIWEPYRTGVQISPWEGAFFRGKDMPGHARRHCRELCKNGCTDRDAVWVVDSGGPMKACATREGTLAPPNEYNWTVRVRRRCDHVKLTLLWPLVTTVIIISEFWGNRLMVVQKSGHPIYFCYNFSKWTRILTIFTVRPITRNVFRKNVNLCVPPHL